MSQMRYCEECGELGVTKPKYSSVETQFIRLCEECRPDEE